jgi:dienelactone hydrolase
LSCAGQCRAGCLVAAMGSLCFASETDTTFGLESRRRAEDIMLAAKATYHFQVFSGVSHGFASRGDEKDPYIRKSAVVLT